MIIIQIFWLLGYIFLFLTKLFNKIIIANPNTKYIAYKSIGFLNSVLIDVLYHIIAGVIICLMKFLFLSEKNILEIKRVREQEQLEGKMYRIISYIKFKTN